MVPIRFPNVSNRVALGLAAGGILVMAVALVPLRGRVDNTNIALILVVGVVAVACTGRRGAAAVAALSAAFWFDFFFTVPFNSPTIASGEDALTAGLLLAVGLAVGQLATWALRQQEQAALGRAHLRRLHRTAEMSAQGEPGPLVVRAVADELTVLLGLRSCEFQPGPVDPLLAHLDHDGAVRWGWVAWGTETLGFPDKGVVLEVSGAGRSFGSFVLVPESGTNIERERLLVAVALADQAGAALAGLQAA